MTTIVTLVVSSLAGVAAILNIFFTRKKVKVDNTVALSDAAMRQVNELQERATDAEGRLDRAVSKADALGKQVDRLMVKIRMLTLAIHDPTVTIERLRVMVPLTQSTNGTRLAGAAWEHDNPEEI